MSFLQCVLGTLVDAYFNGYDIVVVKDTTATPSPEGGLSNVLYNSERVRRFLFVEGLSSLYIYFSVLAR